MYYWGIRNKKLGLIDVEKNEDAGRILSIKIVEIDEKQKIRFREECDSYFDVYYTKEQAIELLEEAIAWIKENG